MRRYIVVVAAVVGLGWVQSGWVSAALVKDEKPPVLKELKAGTYEATVKAIVCGGCGEFIQNTLEENKSLENISVDQKTRRLQFTVKKGSTAQLADLQLALKASADRMGMGADYTLDDLRKKSPK